RDHPACRRRGRTTQGTSDRGVARDICRLSARRWHLGAVKHLVRHRQEQCRQSRPWLTRGRRTEGDYFFFRRGTFLPFLRTLERPMAIACLRLFTLPPRPRRPLLAVPRL